MTNLINVVHYMYLINIRALANLLCMTVVADIQTEKKVTHTQKKGGETTSTKPA